MLFTKGPLFLKDQFTDIDIYTSGRNYFASSSCDGTLKLWDALSKECLKTLDIYPKSNDVDLSKVRGAILFDKKENIIVAKENEVDETVFPFFNEISSFIITITEGKLCTQICVSDNHLFENDLGREE